MCLLLSEVGLRIIDPKIPTGSYWQIDDTIGRKGRPHAEGWWTYEGESYIKFNSAGFRDLERKVEKPANTFRVAVLGDSFTEAINVSLEETYPKILEQMLRECPSYQEKNIEVLNFGISNLGTGQQMLVLDQIASSYSPDLVVLQFFSGNDFRNNYPLTDDSQRPYFSIDNNKLIIDNSFLTSQEYQFRKSFTYALISGFTTQSRLGQLLNHLRKQLSTPRQPRKNNTIEVGTSEEVYRTPQDPKWEKAWEVTEAIILEVQKKAKQLGAPFVMLLAPTSIQVHRNEELRTATMKELGIDNLQYPDQRLQKLGQNHDFDVISIVKEGLQFAQETKSCIHGFPNTHPCKGHWNQYGHELVATKLAEKVCEMGTAVEDSAESTPRP
jgi:hypothetical protein